MILAYDGRSFRFAFTNSRMVEVVLNFVQAHPEVWMSAEHNFALNAAAVASGPFLGGILAAGTSCCRCRCTRWAGPTTAIPRT